MNEQNLKPFTKENAKEMQKRSVEKRKENKTMREIYEEVIANKKNEIFNILNIDLTEHNFSNVNAVTPTCEEDGIVEKVYIKTGEVVNAGQLAVAIRV